MENAVQCAHHVQDDLRQLSLLEPHHQADLLARAAQEARLIQLTIEDQTIAAPTLAEDFERALGQALDAEAPDDAIAARRELMRVLHSLRGYGLKISASVSELTIDSIVGAVKMPVLTARLTAD